MKPKYRPGPRLRGQGKANEAPALRYALSGARATD